MRRFGFRARLSHLLLLVAAAGLFAAAGRWLGAEVLAWWRRPPLAQVPG